MEASPDQLTEARARLRAHFAGDIAEHKDRWSQLWDNPVFLPFDRYVFSQYSLLHQHLYSRRKTFRARAAEVTSSVVNLNTSPRPALLTKGPSKGRYLFLERSWILP